jgi:hypothetical protein
MGKLAQQLGGQSDVKVFKKGGAVHGDEAMDRAMVKKMVKPAALTGKKCGGVMVSKKAPVKAKK